MIDCITLRNPNGFALPSLTDLVRRAFSINALAEDPDAVVAELAGLVENPNVALIVAREDGQWVGLALCERVYSALNPCLSVAHFYNEGSDAVRHKVVDLCIRFGLEAGFKRLIGTDMNAQPRGFQRLFKACGPAKYVGAMYAFDLTRATVQSGDE